MTLHLSIWQLLTFCIVLEIVRELAFKSAAARVPENITYFVGLARQPMVYVGIAAWAVELLGWVAVLQQTPLAYAFPIMTLTYAGIPLASAIFLKERLTRTQTLGAALVALGVLCVGLSGV